MSRFYSDDVETETFTETDDSNRYDDSYRSDERITETETETYTTYDDNYNDRRYDQGLPPPPDVSWPWRPRWDDRERRYIFIHEETGEQVWDYDEVIRRTRRGGYEERTETTYYDGQSSGRRYGGGERIYDDYERDKYRVENDVDDFPENAARWTGRRVQDVEDIPQDVEYDVDRFGNRVEQKFDNAAYDVEDAPEEAAGWMGRKVGDVERFDDNVDNAYDEGRYEGRNDDRW